MHTRSCRDAPLASRSSAPTARPTAQVASVVLMVPPALLRRWTSSVAGVERKWTAQGLSLLRGLPSHLRLACPMTSRRRSQTMCSGGSHRLGCIAGALRGEASWPSSLGPSRWWHSSQPQPRSACSGGQLRYARKTQVVCPSCCCPTATPTWPNCGPVCSGDGRCNLQGGLAWNGYIGMQGACFRCRATPSWTSCAQLDSRGGLMLPAPGSVGR